MANVYDVAAYILEKRGPMTAMKLQKLVYYAQAWALVWDEEPLFAERIEAWANGPVSPCLYASHKGQFKLEGINKGDSGQLSENERDTIDKVLDFYGDKNSQWLSDLTHQEDPWMHARRGLAPGERGDREIAHASMAEYYGGL